MKNTAIILLASIFHFPFSVLTSSAAVPLKWTVETSRLQPAVFDVVRGETLALEASFQSYGRPVATSNMTAFLCWQTNGMANAWWTTNAVTTANAARVRFTPEMDPGATVVNAFIGLSDSTNSSLIPHSSSLSYRAAFTLRFRHGPGASPNAIEQPPKVLDLAHTAVVNEPWPTREDFAATTGVMRAELKGYVEEQIEGAGVVSPQVVTNIVDAKIAALPKEGVSTNAVKEIAGFASVTNGGAKAYADATFRTRTDNVCHEDSFGRWITGPIPTGVTLIGDQPKFETYWRWEYEEGSYFETQNSDKNATHIIFWNDDGAQYWFDAYRIKSSTSGQPFVTADNIPSTNGLASASDVSTLNTGYARLYNFVSGATNANFTATNYPPTEAAAAAKTHWEAEEGMDFSTVPASLQLNERRDGAWRTVMDTRDWTVWYYRFKEKALTNEIARMKAENAALSNRIARAQAWGYFTANGIENPMTDTTVVDRPNMWIMADYEWQKCVSGTNSCWVIRAKNVALSGGANTNGFLEICDAFGRPYMRVNKSAETFADCVFSNITYNADEGAWYVVFGNQAKPTKGGANCEIVGSSSGGGRCILYDEDDPDCPATITWPETADSHAGHWIMKAVPKPVNGVVPSVMFFGAEIKVAGKDYVEYIKEASFGAGIRVGNNVYEAVETGNTLIWQKKVQ